MAGDEGAASQSRKLELKAGLRVAIDGASEGWQLLDAPGDLHFVTNAEPADVIIAFFRAAAELSRLHELTRRIYPSDALWVAWPRRAGGHRSDLTDQVVRAYALALGVVDVKVAAVDRDWSARRFVWRVANRR